MNTYGVYKGRNYIIKVIGQRVILKSDRKETGFSPYIDLAGNLHKDLFIKEVEKNELDEAFHLTYIAIYKENEFEVLNEIYQDTDEIELFTMDSSKAEAFGFIRHDQFTYKKTVSKEDLDQLTEVKVSLRKDNKDWC